MEPKPKTLDEALAFLEKAFSSDDLERLRREGWPPRSHFSSGMSIRNEWGLWRGSDLAKHFNGMGIFHADDMSGIIMDSLVRKLRGKPLDVPEQVKRYRDHWEKENPKVNKGELQ